MGRRSVTRASSRACVAGVVVALALGGCSDLMPEALPLCTSGDVVLTPEQAANAATIAAVGKRVGLPDRAVTVALATAYQESGLRNLDYGDRDSLGLFQQRPSQGWGSPAAIQTPRLSASKFYARLRTVDGWEGLPLTVAAQRVQRSAFPDAYARWEANARQLTRALTGEVPAGLACRFDGAPKPGVMAALRQQAVAELGPGGLDRTQTPVRAWATASWLVAHASSYGVSTVSLAGRTWQSDRGSWKADPEAGALTWS